MTYALRLDVLRLLAMLREWHNSTARCNCGRMYRLTLEPPRLKLIETIAAALDDEPHEAGAKDDPTTPSRFALIETDD